VGSSCGPIQSEFASGAQLEAGDACRPFRTGGSCRAGNEPDESFEERNNVQTLTMLTGLPATDSRACEDAKGAPACAQQVAR